jgi:hypothetical protein
VAIADELPGAWEDLVDGGLVAIRLTSLLELHAREAGEAARLGAEERYADALEHVTAAEEALAAVAPAHERLARVTDTSVLD